MGRHKGGKNNYYSKEEKIKIVKEMSEYNLSQPQASKKYNINQSILGRWRKDYLEKGEQSLENQKKPGNPLCKYSNKKNLTDMENFNIENERLKKGYLVKGDGTVVIFKNSLLTAKI